MFANIKNCFGIIKKKWGIKYSFSKKKKRIVLNNNTIIKKIIELIFGLGF